MKGSTAGARHLAESLNWLEWNRELEMPDTIGTLMEAALAHWVGRRFVEFVRWSKTLPC